MPKRIYRGKLSDDETGKEVFSFEIAAETYGRMADDKSGDTLLTFNLIEGSSDVELVSSVIKGMK